MSVAPRARGNNDSLTTLAGVRCYGIARHRPVFSRCGRRVVEIQTIAALHQDLIPLFVRATLCHITSEKHRCAELRNIHTSAIYSRCRCEQVWELSEGARLFSALAWLNPPFYSTTSTLPKPHRMRSNHLWMPRHVANRPPCSGRWAWRTDASQPRRSVSSFTPASSTRNTPSDTLGYVSLSSK